MVSKTGWIAAPMLLLLVACGPSNLGQVEADNARLKRENAALATDNMRLINEASNTPERPTPPATPANDAVMEGSIPAPSKVGQDLCWQDYCPCEPNPDNNAMEHIHCRNLRAGIPVEAELLSAAAGMRDARRAMREWERDNPGP